MKYGKALATVALAAVAAQEQEIPELDKSNLTEPIGSVDESGNAPNYDVAAAKARMDKFCNQATDVPNCKKIMKTDENLRVNNFCFRVHGETEDFTQDLVDCLQDEYQRQRDGFNENAEVAWATQEETLEDFIQGIADDPMLQNVMAEINSIENYLDAQGVTRRYNENANDDGNDDVPEGVTDANNSMEALKRFVELKQLVSWLQPKDKRISRYCFYGCWCLPEGAHSFVAGVGRPVDLVDKACQYLWFCYSCAKEEFRGTYSGVQKECIPDKRKYDFRFTFTKGYKTDYNLRDIKCRDTFYDPIDTKEKWRSSCARAICECDRGLAKRLYRAWKHWDKSRHRIWSRSVTSCPQKTECDAKPAGAPGSKEERAKAACTARGCLFIVDLRCLKGSDGDGVDHNMECCGLYEDEGSRFQQRDHGGTHECCNHDRGTGTGFSFSGNWYNTITHCCPNGVVLPAGSGQC